MTNRYFADKPLPETPEPDQTTVLAGPEAHHVIHVMRAAPGDRAVLFDGSGAEFPAEVVRVGRADVELKITAREEIDRELPIDITLGVAMPKGDRRRWLVEKATELGLRRIVPLRTKRSVAQPGKQAIGRLRRTVIEASKQCGRNRLMEIAGLQDWAEFVAGANDAACRLLAHPCGDAGTIMAALAGSLQQIVLAVGPEGGLTDDEVSLATGAGWQPVDLGERTLRVETAAICLAVVAATLVGWDKERSDAGPPM